MQSSLEMIVCTMSQFLTDWTVESCLPQTLYIGDNRVFDLNSVSHLYRKCMLQCNKHLPCQIGNYNNHTDTHTVSMDLTGYPFAHSHQRGRGAKYKFKNWRCLYSDPCGLYKCVPLKVIYTKSIIRPFTIGMGKVMRELTQKTIHESYLNTN